MEGPDQDDADLQSHGEAGGLLNSCMMCAVCCTGVQGVVVHGCMGCTAWLFGMGTKHEHRIPCSVYILCTNLIPILLKAQRGHAGLQVLFAHTGYFTCMGSAVQQCNL